MTEQTQTEATQSEARSDSVSQGSGELSTSDLAQGTASSGQKSDLQRETVSPGGATGDQPPLFDSNESGQFRSQWQEIQSTFVDDPQRAVKEADGLVAQTMKRLAEVFADERQKLEAQWSSGEDVDTEALRVALQRYRSFFDRLLSV
jgi:hypothetical protein